MPGIIEVLPAIDEVAPDIDEGVREIDEVVRGRVARVFRFLQAFHQLKNPVPRLVTEAQWFLRLDDVPKTACSAVIGLREASPEDDDTASERSPEPVLRVKRPKLTECPAPPAELIDWLSDGWRNYEEDTVKTRPSRAKAQATAELEHFEDSSSRREALRAWTEKRTAWCRAERPLRKAHQLFQKLYGLHGDLSREGERFELVLGDGNLLWKRADGDAHHPILLRPVQLQFDPDVPEFTVTEADSPVDLYMSLFSCFEDTDPKKIAECRDEVMKGGVDPLLGEDTNAFLRRLAHTLSAQGSLVTARTKPPASEYPQIYRRPILFLRPRSVGFAGAIENIVHAVEGGADVPGSILRIAGVEPVSQGERHSRSGFSPEDVLLSKEANEEQVAIVKRLHDHGSVLVQGPPGTGKSHTIANLVGHLLAHGQSVLVTSHTTKALSVLRDHVVEELRPLCVSVLDNEVESQRQLQTAVTNIADRLSRSDRDQLAAAVKGLEQQRADVIRQLGLARANLRDARLDEHRDVLVGCRPWKPFDAAKAVAAGVGKDDWIPSPFELGKSLPLAEAELVELYATNDSVPPADETALADEVPDPASLPAPAIFEAVARRLAQPPVFPDAPEWWVSGSSGSDDTAIEDLAAQLASVAGQLASAAPWEQTAALAGLSEEGSRLPWNKLAEGIERAAKLGQDSADLFVRFDVALPADVDPEELERTANEVLAEVEREGSISFMARLGHRSWARFIGRSSVGGARPSTPDHFRALAAAAALRRSRSELGRRWSRLMERGGAPTWSDLGERPEAACGQYASRIVQFVTWKAARIDPLVDRLKALGFRWEAFASAQPAEPGERANLDRLVRTLSESLPPILQGRAEAVRRAREEAYLRRICDVVTACAPRGPLHDEVLTSIVRRDPDRYERTYGRVASLTANRASLKRRQQLLGRLEGAASGWAGAIRRREGPHGQAAPPGSCDDAWTWVQLHGELERRAAVSLPDLQANLDRLEQRLRQLTVDLIDKRAWSAQITRTNREQQQALVGWLDLVRKIGKGTGKRAPVLRAKAALQMKDCRKAVPVWIMPLSRVAEMFDAESQFDVVIVDEASQCDVLGLVALFMGKRVVIVGDHEQVSPSAVGQNVARIDHLIGQYLEGVPNSALYDGKTSIYDLARQSFGGLICLTEHFRCYPDIIEFSNGLSYDWRIKPLREPVHTAVMPFVVPYRVTGGTRSDDTNPLEAAHVASLIVACASLPEYGGATFGAISMLGSDQALEIERILRERMHESEYIRRRILCGNAAQFQGDERSVVFLSLVYSSTGGVLSMVNQPAFQQRFNVAASRARDQMWVVHSLDHTIDLQPGDLRRRLIEHALDPRARARERECAEKRVESNFERLVLQRLLSRGFRVRPQVQAGAYRIDLVVEGSVTRLAVECDGERYHTPDKLEADMARQAILERLGWRFSRIRGSLFYRDPERALRPVYERLEALGIKPAASAEVEPPTSALQATVIEKARALRQEWGLEPTKVTPVNVSSPPSVPPTNGTAHGTPGADPLPIRPVRSDGPIVQAPPPLPLSGNGSRLRRIESVTGPVSSPVISRNGWGATPPLVDVSPPEHRPALPASLPAPPPLQLPLAIAPVPPARDRIKTILTLVQRGLPPAQRVCPRCSQPMRFKISTADPYLSCPNPGCGEKRAIPEDVLRSAVKGASQPCVCGNGRLVLRKATKTFLGCSLYPSCTKSVSWGDAAART